MQQTTILFYVGSPIVTTSMCVLVFSFPFSGQVPGVHGQGCTQACLWLPRTLRLVPRGLPSPPPRPRAPGPLLCVLASTCVDFVTTAVLTGVSWCLTGVSVCIFLAISE